MELEQKTILVYGMGISGKGVASLLKNHENTLILYDGNEKLDRAALLKELDLTGKARVITGKLQEADLQGVDILALSPGVSVFAPDVVMAAQKGIRVLGEVEIASEIAKGRLIAITGTNGKTTTTALCGEIMKAAFGDVFVVGNIGNSFAAAADAATDESVLVAEISSFQLESIDAFHPEVSAVLNLTPDHLDRHKTFENYAEVKLQIAKNQSPEETVVINYDDEYLRKISQKAVPKKLYFSRRKALEEGVFLQGETIVCRMDGVTQEIVRRSEMHLVGDHNVENVMAACAIAIAMGVDIATVAAVIRGFQAVEHRIEYVCEKNGVVYYNDSKGTNTDAAAKAVSAMSVPTVLIAGGYDKGADFTEWINGFEGKVRDLILIGQTAEKIKETALGRGFTNVHMQESLQEAVQLASTLAKEGEAVLLSPACASWGQFTNYEERGRLFKEYVHAL